jgi:hypothetical protein
MIRHLTDHEHALLWALVGVAQVAGTAAVLGVGEPSVVTLLRKTATRRTVQRARRVLCNVGPCWVWGDT